MISIRFLLCFTFLLSSKFLSGQQYISVKPSHPSHGDTVEVIFDASAGSKGLEDCECDVYIHTGLFTGTLDSVGELNHVQGAWGKADPRLKMEPIGENRYRFTFLLGEFYGLEEGEEYLQMNFLFRNADGSKEGLTLEKQAVQIPSLTYLANRVLDNASGKDGRFLGKLTDIQYDRQGGIVLYTEKDAVQFHFLEGNIVRVSYLPDGRNGLSPTPAIVANPAVKKVEMEEGEQSITYHIGDGYRILVERDPLRFAFYHEEKLLMKDAQGFFSDKKDKVTGVRFAMQEGERIYGTGSRALPANRRGYRLPCFHSAVYGYTAGEPMLNMSIPYYYSSRGYGILMDNERRAYFDLGKTEEEVLEFGAADDRGMSYFFIPARIPSEAVAHYTYLTGRQPMPPRWSLGYIQSRYGYKSQAEALEMVENMQAADFLMDAMVLDYFWYGEKDVMGNFDWDRDNWPDPIGMMQELKAKGVQTISISQPYVVRNSKNFALLDSLGFLTRNKEGKSYIIEDFWAGPAGLLDIFNTRVQDWLWSQYQARLNEGLGGLWVDLAEPENHPPGMLHMGGSAEELHNLYPSEWNKFMYERFHYTYPERRFFNLSRSGFAGTQRYSTFPWSGDVSRSWEALAVQPAIMLDMGLSGIAYMHSDLGGFAGGEKDPELYTRWMQFGTFSPIMRAHGANIPSEPIHFDEETQRRVREAIRLRYKMLPYNYTLAWENSQTGLPLARPLFFHHPEDEKAYEIDDQYLWGRDMMIAPVLRPDSSRENIDAESIYMPDGLWLDFYEPAQDYVGGKAYKVELNPDRLPVFVRAGAIIPMQSEAVSVSDFSPDAFEFVYFPDQRIAASTSQMYLDDGHTEGAYGAGSYLHLNVEAEASSSRIYWDLTASGRSFEGMPETCEFFFVMHQVEGKIKKANWLMDKLKRVRSYDQMKANTATYFQDEDTHTLYVHVTWQGGPAELSILGKELLSP